MRIGIPETSENATILHGSVSSSGELSLDFQTSVTKIP